MSEVVIPPITTGMIQFPAGTVLDKLAVPYLRVSTDDKGQDPQRQMIAIGPWAAREGIALLEPAVDEGTSASKVPALKRPIFIEACQRAQAARASIVMEVPDRFSRQDPDVAIWEKVEVERRYGVELQFACMSLEMQRTVPGKFMCFMHLGMGHMWVEDHRKKVLSGNVRARQRGQRLGRAPKQVSWEEEQQIVAWRSEKPEPVGWETIANRISLQRVPVPLTDKKEERRRKISASALKRWWAQHNVQNNDSDEPEHILGEAGEGARDALTMEASA